MRDIVMSFGPVAVLILIALAAAYYYIDPAPPHHIVISVGREDSDYQKYASKYKEILARDNIKLEIRQTEGTLDNFHRLKSDDSVDTAFLIDGLREGDNANILSLGSISYEPIWMFYRNNITKSHLSDFVAKRIAIGKDGSGIQILAKRLLAASGITQANSTLVPTGREDAVSLLERNRVDAIFLIGQPDSPLIKKLMTSPDLRTFDFDQANAYTRRFPFLHELVLPHGTIDLYKNIPSTDLHVLATTTVLAVRDNLHPAIISLLMKAMTEVHDGPGLFHKEHSFPVDKDVDFDLSKDAQRYYKSGPPLLQHYLPFWLATLIDRTIVVAIPLFALLIPISKTAPMINEWRVKRRINRWYEELILIETRMRKDPNYDEYLRKIEWIEEQVTHVPIPISFSDYLFVLKEHIELVRRNILRFKEAPKDRIATK